MRLAVAFAAVSVSWVVLAPAYSAVLASTAGLLAPVLEREEPVRYELADAKVLAVRPMVVGGQRASGRYGLWDARLAWSLPLLIAMLLAIPGWAPTRRWRAIAYAITGMSAVYTSHLAANIVLTQLRSPGADLASWSPLTRMLVAKYSYFLDVMGNGLAALVLFCLLVERFWRPTGTAIQVGRNEPCPCGSGRKSKRCCGAAA